MIRAYTDRGLWYHKRMRCCCRCYVQLAFLVEPRRKSTAASADVRPWPAYEKLWRICLGRVGKIPSPIDRHGLTKSTTASLFLNGMRSVNGLRHTLESPSLQNGRCPVARTGHGHDQTNTIRRGCAQKRRDIKIPICLEIKNTLV